MAEVQRIQRAGDDWVRKRIGEKEEGRQYVGRAAPRWEHTEGKKGAGFLLVYQFAESKPNYLRHEAKLRSQQAAAGDPMKERCAAGAWAAAQSAQCFYLEVLQVSWNLLLAGEKTRLQVTRLKRVRTQRFRNCSPYFASLQRTSQRAISQGPA